MLYSRTRLRFGCRSSNSLQVAFSFRSAKTVRIEQIMSRLIETLDLITMVHRGSLSERVRQIKHSLSLDRYIGRE